MKNLNVAGLMMMALAAACGPSPQDPLPPASSSSGGSSSGSTSSSSSSGGQQCPEVLCALYCESGFQAGADGCPTCQCNPNSSSSSSSGGSTTSSSSGGPICDAIACFAYCPTGFRADAQGCPTCECLPGRCGAIGDENICRNTVGCEPVFFNDQGGSSSGGIGCGMGAPPSQAAFECCTMTPEGVFCDGLPPPPPQDCRTLGCSPGFACEGTGACPVSDCACAQDVPCDCGIQPPCDVSYQCVPVNTGDCRSTGCAYNETCQPQPICEIAQCYCDPSALNCDCPPPPPCAFERWACEPTNDLCATVRCGGGTVCQVFEACTGGGGGTCGCPANDPTCDCAPPPPSGCQQIAQCVPVQNDCSIYGCAAGETCQEMTVCSGGTGCACPAGQACDCPAPTPGTCTSSFQCVPVNPDPCTSLTEDQCALDYDLCSPVYASECPPCADPTTCGACLPHYAGCVSIQSSTDAGPPRTGG